MQTSGRVLKYKIFYARIAVCKLKTFEILKKVIEFLNND